MARVAWSVPEYTLDEVDLAGQALVRRNGDTDEHSLRVISNWRSCHAFPLNTFQATLRYKARQIDATSLVAQRTKRLSSIDSKLSRYDWLTLSEMQDIGGCRAVVAGIDEVRELVTLYERSRIKHALDKEDDYITEPKRSGYRGIHRIYRYHSDRSETYQGLKIEMQFRSQRQHAWATAVETAGTFLRQALKSSQGEADWLRFFALMGSEIAHREGCPPVPGTPDDRSALRTEIREAEKALDIRSRLRAFSAAIQIVQSPDDPKARYYLLILDPGENTVTIQEYRQADLDRAANDYLDAERSIQDKPGADAVLVSVDALTALQRAYPNYFLDTRSFLSEVALAVRT
jgi:RelA/SpoT family protein